MLASVLSCHPIPSAFASIHAIDENILFLVLQLNSILQLAIRHPAARKQERQLGISCNHAKNVFWFLTASFLIISNTATIVSSLASTSCDAH
jgi:hypothetical protein